MCLAVLAALMTAAGVSLASCTYDNRSSEPVEEPRPDTSDMASDTVAGSDGDDAVEEREQQEAYEDWMYQQNVAADLAATSGV